VIAGAKNLFGGLMTAEVSSLNWLILGHKGFIGSSLIQYCKSANIIWSTLDKRIDPENAEKVVAPKIQKNTLVVNCIASGVTPETGNLLTDLETNYKLIELLTDSAHRHEAAGFIQFGSNYELTRDVFPLSTRSSYVQSKIRGSNYCKKGISDGRKIKLVYLPTVIGSEQPTGRFFKDFVSHAVSGEPFQINHPSAEVAVVTIVSMIKQLGVSNQIFEPGIHEIVEDFRGTVSQLSTILNEVLIDCGLNKVNFSNLQESGDSVALSKGIQFQPSFRNEVKKQILRMV
jgi:nucleoside-diphosphate-sugar epimerase